MSRRRIHSDEEEDGDADSMREEDRPKRKRTTTKASLAEGGDDDDGEESDGYQPGQRSASKEKKGRKTKRKSEDDDDDDFDEGDASPPEGADDGASDSDQSEFHDKYDADFYIDDADRRYMASLTEKDREMEFARRYEEREKARSRWEIMRSIKQDNRTPGRRGNKEREQKSKIIGELKEKRLQKEKKDKEDEKRRTRERSRERAREAAHSDMEDDMDYDDDALQAIEENEVEAEDSRPANFEQIQSIRLSRNRLELWCCEPFFGDVVKDCFVRIGIGMHNNVQVYRLCQITGIKEGQTYSFGRTRTHFRLLLKHGPSERLFRMEMISNQPFTQSEYDRWKKELKDNNMQIPSVSAVSAKARDLDSKRHYEHSAEDVAYIVALKKKLGIAFVNPMREKEDLLRKLDQARDGRLDGDVNEIEEKVREIQESSRSHMAKIHSDIRGISMVNQRNKEIDAAKKDLLAAKSAVEDVFTRKHTIPMLTSAPAKAPAPKPVEEAKPVVRDPVDDFYEAHNVQLNIALPPMGDFAFSSAPAPIPATAPATTSGVGSSRLSLDEYNRRRGL